MDEILGVPYKVLDDGFVRVVDYMGTDQSIVQAARVSYGKGTKKTSQDRELIRYLIRHWHTSPFEMCEIKLHLRVPMDCWRQWIRHRTANVNEYSTRYSEAIDATAKTLPEEWRLQSKSNKQASEGFLEPDQGNRLTDRETQVQLLAREVYRERLEVGIAREQARKDLPLSTYTESYWKIDLHNLLRFLKLRLDPTAQLEIRSYARVIGYDIVKTWCPIVWEAFEDYVLSGLALSRGEQEVLAAIHGKSSAEEIQKLSLASGFLAEGKQGTRVTLEGREFEEKLKTLGIPIPWE